MHEAKRLHDHAESDALRAQLSRFMNPLPCPACEGRRLRKESLAVKLSSSFLVSDSPLPSTQNPEAGIRNGLNIHDFTALPIREALA